MTWYACQTAMCMCVDREFPYIYISMEVNVAPTTTKLQGLVCNVDDKKKPLVFMTLRREHFLYDLNNT